MRSIAFVAGATGYTGSHLVAVLREHAVPTVAHVRPDSPALADWTSRFDAIGADVDTTAWEPKSIAATIARTAPAYIFALLGTTRARARTDQDATYEHVDYGMTHMLLTATRDHAPSALFVYLSSIGARENTRNDYLAVRGRIERELRESGVDHLIARPAFISGNDRREPRPAERLGARFLDAALRLAGTLGAPSLAQSYTSMTGRELAHGLVGLALAHRQGIVGPRELRTP